MFRIQIARAFSMWKLRPEKIMEMKDMMRMNSYSTCLIRLSKVSDIDKDEKDTYPYTVHPPEDFKGLRTNRKMILDGKIFTMLKIYKSLHNNLHIFPSYKIPAEDPWPIEFHGYPLGKTVSMIRTNRDYIWEFFVFRLNTLGFIWKALDYRFNKADQAMQVFKMLYGHLMVPQSFVVPIDSVDWPRPLWGYNLGKTVHHIRCNGMYPSKRNYLEEMGFQFEVKHARPHDFKLIKKCIKIYKKKFGTFQIPQSYVVPADDKDYPARARGIPLGQCLCNIVHRKDYSKHHDELREMGVSLTPRHELKFNLYFEALQRYKEIHGNLSMRLNYVVPEDSDKFPPHLWGIKLGRVVSNIKRRGDFKPYHDQLQALGLTPAKAIDKAVETPAEGQTQPLDDKVATS